MYVNMRELLGSCMLAMRVEEIARKDIVLFETWARAHGWMQDDESWSDDEDFSEYTAYYFDEVQMVKKGDEWYIQAQEASSPRVMLYASGQYTGDDNHPRLVEQFAKDFVEEQKEHFITESFINQQKGR